MHVSRCRAATALLTTALLGLLTGLTGFLPGARAEDYPSRPVRLITDSAPGSAIDVPVRLIAEGLSRIWGQQAVVVNQPGAGGAIAARSATTAAPDGYTFGVMALSAFVALPGTAGRGPARRHSGRLPWRRADAYRSCALARGENAAGFDRAGETKARRVVLRRQRHWPPDASDRRTSATASEYQIIDGALYRRYPADYQRHDG
jgi:hypothetical protein